MQKVAMTIGATLFHNARVRGNAEALVVGARRLTWREWNSASNRLAHAALALGVKHGDRVVFLLDNSVEFVVAYYAFAKIGCVIAPVMPRSPAREIAQVMQDLRAKVVLVEAMAHDALQTALASGTRPDIVIGVGPGHGQARDFDALVSQSPDEEPAPVAQQNDQLMIKFTSGTTGRPKGCVRSHGNFLAAAMNNLIEIPLDPSDRALVAAPLAAGMAISQMTMLVVRGVAMVMLPRFDPEQFLGAVSAERPSLVYLMDGMSRRLFAHPGFETADLSSIRLYHPVNAPDVMHRLRSHPSFQGGLTSGYASSEGGGLISVKTPDVFEKGLSDPDAKHLVATLGRETLLCRIECLDEELQPAPAGIVGELAISGPSVFQGYWEKPAETGEVLRNGWLLTGDLAYKDADGLLYLQGRKRDVIKSGGMSVYPAEVESVILSAENVAAAVVIGVPDPNWGEKVVAFVVPNGRCDEAEVIALCRAQLAPFKCPKAVMLIERLPSTDVGKVAKTKLVELYAATSKAKA
jgi:acyl-CoA synthetase (AMP-forming)/AMP-acid ligase II